MSGAARLAVFATHPIQYHVPWFRALAARPEIALEVLYAHLPEPQQQGAGFGVPFQWDIPMLDGYPWRRLANARRAPELSRFFGSSTRRSPACCGASARTPCCSPAGCAAAAAGAMGGARRNSAHCARRVERVAQARRRRAHRAPDPAAALDAFLAIGRANRAFYPGYGVPENRLFDCPYFVDNARFAAGAAALASSRDAIRSDWRIPRGATCFLFAGKLQPKKRVLDLLRALARVPREAGERHVLIVGTGEQMEQAKAVVAAEGLSATFAGFLNQTEMPKAYVAADCLVLPPDEGETWGLVVNEAMACGRPASSATASAADPTWWKRVRPAACSPVGTSPPLRACCTGLFSSPRSSPSSGARARAHVARYSVDAAVTGTLAAVRAVTSRKR